MTLPSPALTRTTPVGPVAIPKTRALLRFVYLGRISVAAALYLVAVYHLTNLYFARGCLKTARFPRTPPA